jgi:hypothetical protein
MTGVCFFSIIEKETGQWIGRIGPWFPHQWPGTEVGWSLHRDAMGKGYALEASVAAMDYAVDVLGWDDIIHTIDPGNVASAKLAGTAGVDEPRAGTAAVAVRGGAGRHLGPDGGGVAGSEATHENRQKRLQRRPGSSMISQAVAERLKPSGTDVLRNIMKPERTRNIMPCPPPSISNSSSAAPRPRFR